MRPHERNSIMDRLLSLDEVASYVKMPKGTLYKYTSRNSRKVHLKGIRIGRSLRFRLEDVEKWLLELEVK